MTVVKSHALCMLIDDKACASAPSMINAMTLLKSIGYFLAEGSGMRPGSYNIKKVNCNDKICGVCICAKVELPCRAGVGIMACLLAQPKKPCMLCGEGSR